MPSGTNGSHHKQDTLELRGDCRTPQPSHLPTTCTHTEVTQNEDYEEPHDAVL